MEIAVVAQLVGVIGLILSVILYQMRKRSQILFFRMTASAVFVIHFALLGAWTGSAMNVLSAVRTYIFKKRTETVWADHHRWLFLFLGLTVVFLVFSWEGYRSILPFIGLFFGTLAFWSKNPKTIRLISLIPPPAWFTYDWIVRSYPGMAVEIFMFISIIVGIIRFDILGKKENSPRAF